MRLDVEALENTPTSCWMCEPAETVQSLWRSHKRGGNKGKGASEHELHSECGPLRQWPGRYEGHARHESKQSETQRRSRWSAMATIPEETGGSAI